MFRVLYTCLTLLFLIPSGRSQNLTQQIRGIVLDQITEQTLIGAEVFVVVDGNIIGDITDENGEFRLPAVPIGRRSIRARYLGYVDGVMANIELGSGKAPYLTITMTESVESLKEVTVIARIDKAGTINSSATVSARTFSVEEASQFPGSFNDPARMAQSFAGVVNSDDENNEIVIRGNSPRGVLWRLEGLEIPNPNHYRDQGGSGGAINIIPDVVLTNSDFFTGAFPSEYGNALSGVFDLKLRKGNDENKELALQVGALGLQAAIEGPLTRKAGGSYLFNYRYSTVSILEQIGIEFTDEDEQTPVFQDAAFNVALPLSSLGSFNIYGIWGRSTAGDIPIRDSLQWQSESQRYTYQELYRTLVLGVSHKKLFKNNRTRIHTGFSFNSENDYERDFYIQDDYSDLLLEEDQYEYTSFRFNTVVRHKFDRKLHGELGIYADRLAFDINFSDRVNGALIEFVSEKDHTFLLRNYAQLLYRPSDQFTVNGGLHHSYFVLTNQSVLEPRVGFSLKTGDKSRWSYGAGLHSRLEPISLYLARNFQDDGSFIRPNEELGLTRSWHNVLAWDYGLSPVWRIKTELYYQHLFNVPVFPTDFGGISSLNFSSGFTNQKLLNEGEGRNYGLDFTLEKFMNKGHFFLLTTSLFESEFKATEGEWFDTRYNISFSFNVLTGKEWRVGKLKNNALSLSSRIILHGGRRYTPVDEQQSIENGFIINDYSKYYGAQIPNFFRTDFSLKYKKNKKKWSWSLSLDIQNVLDRQNVLERRYSLNNQAYFDQYQLSFLPVLNYRVEL